MMAILVVALFALSSFTAMVSASDDVDEQVDITSGITLGEALVSESEGEIKIVEVGYYCKPRKYGVSKTSTNYFVLLKLSLPYIKAAFSRSK